MCQRCQEEHEPELCLNCAAADGYAEQHLTRVIDELRAALVEYPPWLHRIIAWLDRIYPEDIFSDPVSRLSADPGAVEVTELRRAAKGMLAKHAHLLQGEETEQREGSE